MTACLWVFYCDGMNKNQTIDILLPAGVLDPYSRIETINRFTPAERTQEVKRLKKLAKKQNTNINIIAKTPAEHWNSCKLQLNSLKYTETPWLIPKFFKLGLNLLCGPAGTGKTRLCLQLARSNYSGHLWERGPKGDGRQSVFVPTGLFYSSELSVKMAGDSGEWGVKVAEPFVMPQVFFRSEYPSKVCPQDSKYLQKIALDHKPAMIFFDWYEIFGKDRKRLEKQIRGFCDSLPADNTTAFVGVINKRWPQEFKGRFPIVATKLKGDQVEIHNIGCVAGHGRSLIYSLKNQLIELREDGDSPCQHSPAKKNRALFLTTINKLVARQPNGLTNAEVKKHARQAGVSQYFLQKVKWADYGFATQRRGFGPEYREYLEKKSSPEKTTLS